MLSALRRKFDDVSIGRISPAPRADPRRCARGAAGSGAEATVLWWPTPGTRPLGWVQAARFSTRRQASEGRSEGLGRSPYLCPPALWIRFRRSAKRELFDLDDDAFLRVARVILELEDNPRPRGHDKVAGREDQLRIWAGRDRRVLYEVDEQAARIIIVAVRKKDESTYR